MAPITISSYAVPGFAATMSRSSIYWMLILAMMSVLLVRAINSSEKLSWDSGHHLYVLGLAIYLVPGAALLLVGVNDDWDEDSKSTPFLAILGLCLPLVAKQMCSWSELLVATYQGKTNYSYWSQSQQERRRQSPALIRASELQSSAVGIVWSFSHSEASTWERSARRHREAERERAAGRNSDTTKYPETDWNEKAKLDDPIADDRKYNPIRSYHNEFLAHAAFVKETFRDDTLATAQQSKDGSGSVPPTLQDHLDLFYLETLARSLWEWTIGISEQCTIGGVGTGSCLCSN